MKAIASDCNVGWLLTEMAERMPDAICVVEPAGRDGSGRARYRQVTFRELDEDSSRIAAGLLAMGIPTGTRLVLLVRPSIDFVSLVFALFKTNFRRPPGTRRDAGGPASGDHLHDGQHGASEGSSLPARKFLSASQ
jgi:long-subunit acyl-CoA synthetase (AMP-forming)